MYGKILIELIGGLGLFISGMNMMSKGIEKVAGERLRTILETFTRNKFLGMIVGIFFTAMIQSSSAATVMVVSFVNSGLMMLSEASGIILGANIGTTVTALLVAFRLSAVAPLFVFAGAVMMNYVKAPMPRKAGEVIMGFGILFVGISTMSAAMTSLKDIPEVIHILSNFTNPILGILLGLVITSVVQSSSVTVSILVVMASQGLVDLRICLFVILGCNIGACTSAVLASLDGTKNAKRAALIHLLFNIFSSIMMFVLLLVAAPQIEMIVRFCSGAGSDAGSLGRNIAMAHILVKVFSVIVFYPLTDMIIKCAYMLVPGEDAKEEAEFTLKYISFNRPNPTVAVFLAVQELERMADMAFKNLNVAFDAFVNHKMDVLEEVQKIENYVDYLDEQISNYLVMINQHTLPLSDMQQISAYFHVVGDIERISDHAVNIVELIPKLYANGGTLSEESKQELKAMMDLVNEMLEKSLNMFMHADVTHIHDIAALEEVIDQMEKDLQGAHIRRLNEGGCSAQTGACFDHVVSDLERVGDHATNIAFAIAEAHTKKRISADHL